MTCISPKNIYNFISRDLRMKEVAACLETLPQNLSYFCHLIKTFTKHRQSVKEGLQKFQIIIQYLFYLLPYIQLGVHEMKHSDECCSLNKVH